MTILHCRKKIISAVTLLAVGVGLASFTTPAKASSSDGWLVYVYDAMHWLSEPLREDIRQKMTDEFVRQLQDYGSYFEGQDLNPLP